MPSRKTIAIYVAVSIIAIIAVVVIPFSVMTVTKVKRQRRILDKAHQMEVESDEIVQWLRLNGGLVNYVAVKAFDYGGEMVRGLVAEKDLDQGAMLFKVPRSLFLLPDSASANLEQQEVQLAAEIAEEIKLGEGSQFARYLEALPLKSNLDPTHPFYASNEDLALFSDLPVASKVRGKRTVLHDMWGKHRRGEATDWEWEGNFEWEELLHAFVLQLSRRTKLDLGVSEVGDPREIGTNHQKVLALVPFLDLANIGGSGNMKFEMIDDGDSLEARTLRSVRKGEELILPATLVDGVEKDNGELAYLYGVTLGDNTVPIAPLGAEVCEGLQAAIEELHSRTDRKHQVRMLLSSLVYEACAFSSQSEPQPEVITEGQPLHLLSPSGDS